jgi:hypothetical protein
MKSLTAKGAAPQTARGAGERKAFEIVAPSRSLRLFPIRVGRAAFSHSDSTTIRPDLNWL